MRTTAERPFFLNLDADQRPKWQCPMRGGKIFGTGVFSACGFFGCG
jgi:hypothetical protein